MRRALVTGAAGDLGRACCAALAADGWDVVGADLQRADLVLDVTDLGATEAALARLGSPPGAVVACAGVQGDFVPVHEHDVDAARRVLEVNVVGTLVTFRAAAAAMLAAGAGGSLVALASMAGVSGAPNMPAYSASKAAVIGLVRASARDLAPHGVRVNAVSPGFIGPGAMWDTQVAQQAAAASAHYASTPAEVAEEMVGLVPLGRYGGPAEVADAVAFLAGDRSSYLTGTNLEVAGGSA